MSRDEKLNNLTDKWKGKRITVNPNSDHPHAGESGEVVCFEMAGASPGMLVNGEWGYFYIFDRKDISKIV
jgi:hypothetical protein